MPYGEVFSNQAMNFPVQVSFDARPTATCTSKCSTLYLIVWRACLREHVTCDSCTGNERYGERGTLLKSAHVREWTERHTPAGMGHEVKYRKSSGQDSVVLIMERLILDGGLSRRTGGTTELCYSTWQCKKWVLRPITLECTMHPFEFRYFVYLQPV